MKSISLIIFVKHNTSWHFKRNLPHYHQNTRDKMNKVNKWRQKTVQGYSSIERLFTEKIEFIHTIVQSHVNFLLFVKSILTYIPVFEWTQLQYKWIVNYNTNAFYTYSNRTMSTITSLKRLLNRSRELSEKKPSNMLTFRLSAASSKSIPFPRSAVMIGSKTVDEIKPNFPNLRKCSCIIEYGNNVSGSEPNLK